MSVIPKEQLAEVRPWQFGSFDAPERIDAPPPPEPPPPTEAPTDAGEVVTGFGLPTAEDIERVHNEAHDEGYRAGFDAGQQAGYEAGMAAAREKAERISRIAENFQQSLAGLDQFAADAIVGLALEVARQVVRGTLATRPEAIIGVVREAITALPINHGSVALHLNPADANLLHEHLGNQVGQSGWHLIEDHEVQPGGCLIRSGASEIDATLETRWRRVLEAIGAQAPSPAEP